MKNLSMSLALSLIKASILTLIVLRALVFLSSCSRIADGDRKITNQWRGRIVKNNRLIFVTNTDSLPVLTGDTVTVYLNENTNTYYISNNPIGAADTSTVEMYVDNQDTIYSRFEAWNVVLERRIIK
jgi:hypothetical protein